ncbi:MAG TPA: phenylacetic acid degradation protein PaaN [Bacteroidia bacterium]|nr:phenylacetic acid degradation protein PaaN [Bacteroidia bacterium]
MNQAASLFEKHKPTLEAAIKAIHERTYFTPYPESPRAYAEDADAKGKSYFQSMLNQEFKELLQTDERAHIGEEVSPFLQLGLGITYPAFTPEQLITKAKTAQKAWNKASTEERAGILIETLERIQNRYFDIAYATMHTTGQGFIMSFQASGPHANDRALEAITMGYIELTRFPKEVMWVKNMGKFDVTVKKNWKAVAKGIGLVIGCSTFPTWNTVPGVYADLITGNSVIIKPHPKAILPIAIVVAEIQKVLAENGFDPNIVQLAVDTVAQPITKQLAEHPDVKLVDFTGSSSFGNYVESLKDKAVFTEKAGVNSVLVDSVKDINAVMQNIAFSVSLYSKQMCTAPQNIFISKDGVKTPDGVVSYEDAVNMLAEAIKAIVNNPKMGAGTLGGIQADATMQRIQTAAGMGGRMVLASIQVANPEFENARTASPSVIEVSVDQKDLYLTECFGPVAFVVKTNSREHSLQLVKESAKIHGAITCLAYVADEAFQQTVEEEMNEVFTPVSFNFTGAIFVNQHAAFSDFHVSGGNPAGNASFTNPEYINKRFVWVGNRFGV